MNCLTTLPQFMPASLHFAFRAAASRPLPVGRLSVRPPGL
jgi:hypothetical protein